MATGSILETERDYPSSDGKPFAETDFHRRVMVDLIQVFEDRYRNRPDVYVSGDLLIYYEQGNKRLRIDPDVFVVFGVEKRSRLNYLLWQEGKGPDFIVEVTSKSTRREDQTKKHALYRDVLKVPEYFLFDPLGEYLRPALQGYRLVDDEYVPIAIEEGGLTSALLSVRLTREGRSLRLIDLATGERLLTRAEFEAQARLAAEERAEAAEDRLRRLQAEHERALAELKRLKGSE